MSLHETQIIRRVVGRVRSEGIGFDDDGEVAVSTERALVEVVEAAVRETLSAVGARITPDGRVTFVVEPAVTP